MNSEVEHDQCDASFTADTTRTMQCEKEVKVNEQFSRSITERHKF
jgi:hypothetical protein